MGGFPEKVYRRLEASGFWVDWNKDAVLYNESELIGKVSDACHRIKESVGFGVDVTSNKVRTSFIKYRNRMLGLLATIIDRLYDQEQNEYTGVERIGFRQRGEDW